MACLNTRPLPRTIRRHQDPDEPPDRETSWRWMAPAGVLSRFLRCVGWRMPLLAIEMSGLWVYRGAKRNSVKESVQMGTRLTRTLWFGPNEAWGGDRSRSTGLGPLGEMASPCSRDSADGSPWTPGFVKVAESGDRRAGCLWVDTSGAGAMDIKPAMLALAATRCRDICRHPPAKGGLGFPTRTCARCTRCLATGFSPWSGSRRDLGISRVKLACIGSGQSVFIRDFPWLAGE